MAAATEAISHLEYYLQAGLAASVGCPRGKDGARASGAAA